MCDGDSPLLAEHSLGGAPPLLGLLVVVLAGGELGGQGLEGGGPSLVLVRGLGGQRQPGLRPLLPGGVHSVLVSRDWLDRLLQPESERGR